MLKRFAPVFSITFWLVTSLYFGIGGLTQIEYSRLVDESIDSSNNKPVLYKGVPFANKASVLKFIEESKIDNTFPWIYKIPNYLGYVSACCCFGVVGSIAHLLLLLVKTKCRPGDLNYISIPVLGMICGLVVLAIASVVPSFFFENETKVKSSTIMFFSLFAGVYANTFYEVLEKRLTKVFKG